MIQPATVWSDVRATEKDARRKLQARLQDSALGVPFGRDGEVSDLMGKWEDVDSALSVGLADGMGHWRVVETRYFTSGRVELVGELDLTEWLRPYATRVASAPPDAPNETMRSTGIVVDARHLDLVPSYAPRLIDSQGRVVYDLAALSKDVASIRMPVLWVSDPADSGVVARVGESPALMVADKVEGEHDLVLTSRDAARIRVLEGGTSLLQSAPVVIVVNP